MARIVAITHEFSRTGAPLYLLRLASALRSEGVEVSVIGPVRGALQEAFVDAGVHVESVRWIDRLYVGGSTRVGQLLYAPARLIANVILAAILLRSFVSLRPVLIILSSWSARFASIPARLSGRRIVWHVHEYVGEEGLLSGLARWWLRTSADQLFFNSEATRRWWLRDRSAYASHVLYDGVSIADVVPSDDDRSIDVLFVGRVSREKGVEDLLEAFVRLVERGRSYRLCLAGSRVEEWLIEAWSKRAAALDHLVAMPGSIEDPRALMRRARILVLPSHREGFGRVLLEGMAEGCAIVATRVGGIPEIVADGVDGVLVPLGDPASLADALDRLLQNAALRIEIARRGRAKVRESFAVEKTRNEMVKCYLGLIRGGV